MPLNEEVLVFPRQILDEFGAFRGLNFECRPLLDAIFRFGVARFMPRERAEVDFSMKQIIPYVILECEGRVLFYVRGKKTGETRLVSKGSVGFGGHINRGDDTLFNESSAPLRGIYLAAEKREIEEELDVRSEVDDRLVAVLNDDSTEVGQVHMGIVHVWRLKSPEVTRKERGITRMSFRPASDILSGPEELETWSSLCLESIDQLLSASGIHI